MAKKTFWTEQNKKKVAVGALLACAVVVIYQLFLSGGPSPSPRPAAQSNTPRPGPTPAAAVTPTPKNAPRPDSAAAREELLQRQLADLSPLTLPGHKPVAGAETERGNIFAYFVPTPVPPTPTPPPPPILIRYAQPQNVVAGTPRPVTLVVMGDHFPTDAQIIYGGMAKPTRLSEGALAAELAPGDYSMARTVTIEVKSQSKPVEFYSNQISFVIQSPPPIPFKMVGRIGELAVLEFGGNPSKEYIRVLKGQSVMQFWRVDSMDATGMDVTDTRYDIKSRVRLEEKH